MRALRLLQIAALVVTALGAGVSAQAQTLEPPRLRQGYYIALGMGAGVSQIWEDGDSLGLWGGSSLRLRLGQMITRRLGLGLLVDSRSGVKDPEVAGMTAVAIEGQWEVARNLSVRGAVGLGIVVLQNTKEANAELRGTYGAGYSLAVAYDWFPVRKGRLTGGLAITPFFEVRAIPGDSAAAVSGMIGAEVTWWTGLPRNQLDLPPSEAFKAP